MCISKQIIAIKNTEFLHLFYCHFADMEQGNQSSLLKKDGRPFTGDDPSYPIELFIYIVENESSYKQDQDEKLFQLAWDLIDRKPTTPAGNIISFQ